MRRRQRFGKYRIERLLGHGGFADVYRARDHIEGIRVALKVPHAAFAKGDTLDALLREVRIGARLVHPNILPVKNADVIDGRLVIAYRLGKETLADRLQRRMATKTALQYTDNLLDALAFAHANGVIHCDVKPENLLLMDDGPLCLTDFGIAKVARRTVQNASGSGTVGYQAPEQAFGKPSFRSDVFSAGLVIYRMLSGKLPEWPFDWPPPGADRVRARVSGGMVDLLERSLHVDARKRFADGAGMLRAFRRLEPLRKQRRGRARRPRPRRRKANTDWRHLRQRDYVRRFRRQLPHDSDCSSCGGPVSAPMHACPWCGTKRQRHEAEPSFPASCPRCRRGLKLDWRYCPWCWGPGFTDVAGREYADKRYAGRCGNPRCERRDLMPFMRYCPWCHTKVAKPWKVEGTRARCARCDWGIAAEHWSHCPWCAAAVG